MPVEREMESSCRSAFLGLAEVTAPAATNVASLSASPPLRAPRSLTLVTGTVLIAGGALTFIGFLALGDFGYLLTGLALLVSALPFVVAGLDEPRRLTHPLALIGLLAVFGVAGQTFFITQLADPNERFLLDSGVGDEGLAKGLIVVGLALLTMVLGYAAFPVRRSAPSRLMMRAVDAGWARPDPQKIEFAVAALCLLAVASFVLYLSAAGDLWSG